MSLLKPCVSGQEKAAFCNQNGAVAAAASTNALVKRLQRKPKHHHAGRPDAPQRTNSFLYRPHPASKVNLQRRTGSDCHSGPGFPHSSKFS